jgi:hypothetical protein
MEIRIRNERELQEWDARIGSILQRHELNYVLAGIRQLPKEMWSFTAAGVALFAIRYSLPSIVRGAKVEAMPWGELAPIANLVTQYLLADPVSFDPPVENEYRGSTLIPLMLRQAGNQFIYNIDLFGQYARSLKLFHLIPQQLRGRRNIPEFDFDAAFQEITRVPLVDFIDTGYATFAAALLNPGFSGGWFQKARSETLRFEDETVIRVLDQLAADQFQMRDLYQRFRQQDRRYGAFDYNPLFVHPLVRPWPKREHTTLDEDRMIAPLPQLILTRMSEGLYQQMFYRYREDFSRYFGYLFEEYVGEILGHSVPHLTLLSERDIQRTYKDGKVPDWVVIDGNTAILVESKATGFLRKALATGDKVAIENSVSQVIAGLIQLHEFRDACERHVEGLEILSTCSAFKLLVVTFEPFYTINDDIFREKINEQISEEFSDKGIGIYPWHVLPVDHLEKLQPQIAAGVELKGVIERLERQTFHEIWKELEEQTGRGYQDSFLYDMDIEIYRRLNIPIDYGE